MCPRLADHVANELSFVAVEIVHDDNVTGSERGIQDFLNISFEAVAIDRATEGEGSRHAVKPEGGYEGYGFPVARRHLGEQGLALLEPAPEPCHIGLDPGLVDKDKA